MTITQCPSRTCSDGPGEIRRRGRRGRLGGGVLVQLLQETFLVRHPQLRNAEENERGNIINDDKLNILNDHESYFSARNNNNNK